MKKELVAGFGLFFFSFSLVFFRLCFPGRVSVSSSSSAGGGSELDEEAIAAFNEYASAVFHNKAKSSPRSAAAEGTRLGDSQLGGLFSSDGFSQAQLQPVAVWKHLKRLALRSDLLSKTRDAILDAVTAWEELLKVVEVERSQKNIKEDRSSQCRYSVEWISSSGSNRTIDIPCGFVVDSSVTVAAVPSGSFRIRLLNSTVGAVILDYFVQLNTSNPIIVQSQGNNGSYYEETCPTANSRTIKVDGLDACFQKRKKKSDKKRAPSLSGDFPFAIALPFSATLRLGFHGFHMVLNGKHITSFSYQKDQKPWIVNLVEIQGDVDVYSFMAAGLPVSEDEKHFPESDYLKAPPVSRRPILLVGVFSTPDNLDRRMAIRRSWMQFEAVRSGDVVVRFFVGLDKNSATNLNLWKEASSFNDMQLLPFVDHYELITIKTLAICLYGVKTVRSRFLMKTDDDTFVRIDVVLSLIKDFDPNKALLLGLIEFSAQPNRDESSKWYINEEEWLHPYYPPWAHGAGYLISKEIGKYVVESYEKSNLKLFKLEDVAMGIWISEYVAGNRNRNKRVEFVNHDKFFNLACAPGYVIAHYQKPQEMLCLWKRLKVGAVCC